MAKLTSGLQKIANNITWLLAERVFVLSLSLFISVYVIRYLGAENFGKLSYSVSFVGLFMGIAKLGLDDIVVKKLVEKPEEESVILGSSFFLKILGSLITIALISLAIFPINPDPSIRNMTILIAMGLSFSGLDVIELRFQAKVASKDVVIARMVQFVLSSLLRYLAVIFELPVIMFAGLMVIDNLIKSLGLLIVYGKQSQREWPWQLKKSWVIHLISLSSPLIISAIMTTINLKIDQIMLGNLASNQEVGYYAVAVRFSELWYFVPVMVCASIFPSILEAQKNHEQNYLFKLQFLYDLMAWLALLIAIPILFIAQPLILLLVGEGYAVSGQILMIHIGSSLFVFLGLAGHQWLIAENRTKFSSFTSLCGAVSNIILNYFLIPNYGGKGAAIATFISYGISSCLVFLLYPPTRENGRRLTKAVFIPFRFQQNLIYFNLLKTKLNL